MDLCDDQKEESLDKFENKSEKEGIGYVFFPFVALPQKKSNHMTDMGQRIRNLNHLVCISKSAHHIIAYFALGFLGRKYSKTLKKTYISRFQEGLKSHLVFIASIGSGTTNSRRLIRKRLKFFLLFTHRQSLRTKPSPNQQQDSGSHRIVSS